MVKTNKVVSKVSSKFEYDEYGDIFRYGLIKNKVYTLADDSQISPAPNNDYFIHIIQIDDAVIGHLPEDFYSIEEWRQIQIKKILNGSI